MGSAPSTNRIVKTWARTGTVVLDSRNLAVFPPEIMTVASAPKCVRNLSLNGNKLSSLPPDISTLRSLTRLSLNSNALYSLPVEMGMLTGLEILNLAHNKFVRDLPDALSAISGLQVLSLAHNAIETLTPVVLRGLSNLTDLNVAHNNISVIPADITSLKKLKYLDMAYNRIQTLPPEWAGHLAALEVIDLRHNELSELPPFFVHPNLKKLRLADNRRLEDLPKELVQMSSSLFLVDLSNCPLTNIPSVLRVAGARDLLSYLADRKSWKPSLMLAVRAAGSRQHNSNSTPSRPQSLGPAKPRPLVSISVNANAEPDSGAGVAMTGGASPGDANHLTAPSSPDFSQSKSSWPPTPPAPAHRPKAFPQAAPEAQLKKKKGFFSNMKSKFSSAPAAPVVHHRNPFENSTGAEVLAMHTAVQDSTATSANGKPRARFRGPRHQRIKNLSALAKKTAEDRKARDARMMDAQRVTPKFCGPRDVRIARLKKLARETAAARARGEVPPFDVAARSGWRPAHRTLSPIAEETVGRQSLSRFALDPEYKDSVGSLAIQVDELPEDFSSSELDEGDYHHGRSGAPRLMREDSHARSTARSSAFQTSPLGEDKSKHSRVSSELALLSVTRTFKDDGDQTLPDWKARPKRQKRRSSKTPVPTDSALNTSYLGGSMSRSGRSIFPERQSSLDTLRASEARSSLPPERKKSLFEPMFSSMRQSSDPPYSGPRKAWVPDPSPTASTPPLASPLTLSRLTRASPPSSARDHRSHNSARSSPPISAQSSPVRASLFDDDLPSPASARSRLGVDLTDGSAAGFAFSARAAVSGSTMKSPGAGLNTTAPSVFSSSPYDSSRKGSLDLRSARSNSNNNGNSKYLDFDRERSVVAPFGTSEVRSGRARASSDSRSGRLSLSTRDSAWL